MSLLNDFIFDKRILDMATDKSFSRSSLLVCLYMYRVCDPDGNLHQFDRKECSEELNLHYNTVCESIKQLEIKGVIINKDNQFTLANYTDLFIKGKSKGYVKLPSSLFSPELLVLSKTSILLILRLLSIEPKYRTKISDKKLYKWLGLNNKNRRQLLKDAISSISFAFEVSTQEYMKVVFGGGRNMTTHYCFVSKLPFKTKPSPVNFITSKKSRYYFIYELVNSYGLVHKLTVKNFEDLIALYNEYKDRDLFVKALHSALQNFYNITTEIGRYLRGILKNLTCSKEKKMATEEKPQNKIEQAVQSVKTYIHKKMAPKHKQNRDTNIPPDLDDTLGFDFKQESSFRESDLEMLFAT